MKKKVFYFTEKTKWPFWPARRGIWKSQSPRRTAGVQQRPHCLQELLGRCELVTYWSWELQEPSQNPGSLTPARGHPSKQAIQKTVVEPAVLMLFCAGGSPAWGLRPDHPVSLPSRSPHGSSCGISMCMPAVCFSRQGSGLSGLVHLLKPIVKNPRFLTVLRHLFLFFVAAVHHSAFWVPGGLLGMGWGLALPGALPSLPPPTITDMCCPDRS